MANEPKYPANLKAFCELAVKELGYESIDYVLDVLDANFPVAQDLALDCCFDQGLAWAVLGGKVE